MLRDGKRVHEVFQATGVSKPTLSRWAKAAGIDTLHTERTAQAVAAQAMSYAEMVAQLVPLLGNIAAVGAKATLARLELLFANGVPSPEDLKEADLAKIVGAWTRAIHDLQLLSGKATESFDMGDAVDRQIRELVEELAGTDPARGGGVHASG